MDENNQNTHEKDSTPIADRGLPSIAVHPKGRVVLMAAFLAAALMAITFVIVDDSHKKAPVPLVKPENIEFRSPAGSSGPYIKANSSVNTPEMSVAPSKSENQEERLLQAEALRLAQAQRQKMNQRLRSPQLVYDQAGHHPQAEGSFSASETGNASFMDQYNSPDADTVKARQLQNLPFLIPQGTLISGILETAIQSDLPGMVRAIVSEDVYGFDGQNLLIPQGSRLIGNYRSGLVRGQSRIFVVWSRLIRHDGVSINIGSPGTDSLGRAGLDGAVDTHFFERFGSSVLLSMIDSGLQAGVQSLDNHNAASIALSTGNDLSKSSELALQNSIAIPPTIHVDQGQRIKIFVGRDLDFADVSARAGG